MKIQSGRLAVQASSLAIILGLLVSGTVPVAAEPGAVAAGAQDAGAADPSAQQIPFEKFVLENGLTVILHPDRSDPLVHVDVRYHVGSNREELGRSGFAHLFEHMMFQGSANVGDDEHFKFVSEAGGSANGELTDDWTNYYQTVPSNYLERMLWLEADRMGFLLPAITQEKFESQRDAVKNERRQRFDNVPYGVIDERMAEATYPAGHPYSWHRIGYIDDLDAAQLDDVRKFFERWYGPNNAVLTIGGNFDRAQTLAWVEKYFGSIPRGSTVEPLTLPTVTLRSDRYISMEDKVERPLLRMDFPMDVVAYGVDEAPLDVLSVLFANRPASPLYKALVETGLAEAVGASCTCRELSCVFSIEVLFSPEMKISFSEAEKLVRRELAVLSEQPPAQSDIDAVVTQIVTGKYFALGTVHEKVDQLSLYEMFAGQPGFFGQDIARYKNVTRKTVTGVLDNHILGNAAVIMRVVGEGRQDLVTPQDNWTFTRPAVSRQNAQDGGGGAVASQVVDGFDRSVVPGPSDPLPFSTPQVSRFLTQNSVPVFLSQDSEAPITTVELIFDVGSKDDPARQFGMSALLTAMLEQSIKEVSAELDRLGSSISIESGSSLTAVRVYALSNNAAETFALVEKAILRASFDPEEFTRVKARTISSAAASLKDPSYIASTLFNRIVFGKDNAFAYPGGGLPETLENIGLNDLKNFYAESFTASRLKILAVSSLDDAEFGRAIVPLEQLAIGASPEFIARPLPEITGPVIYLIDRPGAPQSQIRVGSASMLYDHDGPFFRAKLGNHMIGSDFNSRLNTRLREERGFTYRVNSSFVGTREFGRFRINTGVRTDATVAALKDIIEIIGKIEADGITAEELKRSKDYFAKGRALQYESPAQKIYLLYLMAIMGLDETFLEEETLALQSANLASINRELADHLAIDKQVIVIVGDKRQIFDDLLGLDLTVIELDERGNPVG